MDQSVKKQIKEDYNELLKMVEESLDDSSISQFTHDQRLEAIKIVVQRRAIENLTNAVHKLANAIPTV